MASNFERFFAAIAQEFQDLQNAIIELYTLRRLDTAMGEQLDNIGDDFNEPRLGDVDDDYRRRIRAKIICTTGSGTIEDIYDAVGAYLVGVDFHITRQPPKYFELIITDAITLDEAQKTARIVACSKAAGEGATVVFRTALESEFDNVNIGFDDPLYAFGGSILV